jgi:uncharacterized membrane protein YphA (DoxX/SURF4 family)
MKYLVQIVRVILGVLFIFSGMIKLNDPVGFSYKLHEYFEVLNMPIFIPFSLALAILMCSLEILLGVALLIGYQRKWTLWGYSLLMVFFTFLTFYSAYYNKVTDCGCFGDAIPLTPWESFYKDIVIDVLIVILILGRKHIQPLLRKPAANFVMVTSIVFCSWFAMHVINHLPVWDFRPYKVGSSIVEGRHVPEGAPVDEFEIIWVYAVNGMNGEYSTEDEPWNIEGAEFVERKQKLIKKGYEPPIHDFLIEDADGDHTDEMLEEDRLLMIISYNILKAERSPEVQGSLNELVSQCDLEGIRVIGLSASSENDIDAFRHEVQAMYPFYFMDETALKTIVRSSPGLVYLENGTIKGKWHYNDMPTIDGL